MIDTHCHLSHPEFDPDREELIARSWTQGVTAILEVGYSVETSRRAIEIARAHPARIRASVGIHPHEAGKATDADFAEIERLSQEPEVVAIGETGLDFYRDWAPRDKQLALFARTVRFSLERDLPLVIHDRDAHDDVLRILREEGGGKARGIFHCFSGDAEVARRRVVDSRVQHRDHLSRAPGCAEIAQGGEGCTASGLHAQAACATPVLGIHQRHGFDAVHPGESRDQDQRGVERMNPDVGDGEKPGDHFGAQLHQIGAVLRGGKAGEADVGPVAEHGSGLGHFEAKPLHGVHVLERCREPGEVHRLQAIVEAVSILVPHPWPSLGQRGDDEKDENKQWAETRHRCPGIGGRFGKLKG